MICSLAKWCEMNYQGNAGQSMLQTEGKKQVISEVQASRVRYGRRKGEMIKREKEGESKKNEWVRQRHR
jgi:hypothetical protein